MSRYAPTPDDPYVYSDTDGVLRNKAGLRNTEALKAFETKQVALRTAELSIAPLGGKWDLAHLRAIHRHLFADVYDWAGELRTVPISKGSSDFAPIQTIGHTLESWGHEVFRALAHDNHLQGLPPGRFAERLAYHYAEINYLHSFRDGNGRSTRLFLEQLADRAGYALDLNLGRVSQQEWLHASVASFNGELEPVQGLFTRSLMPSRAAAFIRFPEHQALRRHPELQGTYEGLRQLQATLAAAFPDDLNSRETYLAAVLERLAERLRSGEIPQARDVPATARDRDPER